MNRFQQSSYSTKRQSQRFCRFGGFTLLEMLIVLFLVSVVLGSAVALLVAPSDQKRLERQIGKVEQLGRQARGLAVLQQRSYIVTFQRDTLNLAPLGFSDSDTERDTNIGVNGASSSADVTESLTLDEEITFSVKNWQQDWQVIEEREDIAEWVFEPTGVVEPISVRVEFERSWIEQTYHSLTGEVVQEEREVY